MNFFKQSFLVVITAGIISSGGMQASRTIDSMFYDAVKNNQFLKAKILNWAGANVNRQNVFGWNPLHVASLCGYVKIVKFLLTKDIQVNARDSNGRLPLHLATSQDHIEIASVLIDHGADVNAKDFSFGWTSLHYAAFRGYSKASQLLLSHGADINYLDNIGNIPLHWVAFKGNQEIVQLLVNAKANPMLTNNDNNRPSDIAKTEEIKSFLREAEIKWKEERKSQPPSVSIEK